MALAGTPSLRDTHPVDATTQYRQLIALGRDEFLAAAAPAALVRFRSDGLVTGGAQTFTLDQPDGDLDELDETQTAAGFQLSDLDLQIFPLVKKPGASFPDRITIGRTPNNDLVIPDHSVSRLHAYIRTSQGGWVVADAGSKNGSWLRGEKLDPRREKPLTSRTIVRLGDVDLTFYIAPDLFSILGGGA